MIHAARRISACTVTAIVMFALVFLAAITPAQAHSQLLSTDPFDTEQAERAPKQITLTFNEDIVPMGSAIEVLGPDGSVISVGDLTIDGPVVTQALAEVRPKGLYQVSWRVVSADGHPISGEFAFTASNTFPEETDDESEGESSTEEVATEDATTEDVATDGATTEAANTEEEAPEATGAVTTPTADPADEPADSGRSPWRTAILVVAGVGALTTIVARLVILRGRK